MSYFVSLSGLGPTGVNGVFAYSWLYLEDLPRSVFLLYCLKLKSSGWDYCLTFYPIYSWITFCPSSKPVLRGLTTTTSDFLPDLRSPHHPFLSFPFILSKSSVVPFFDRLLIYPPSPPTPSSVILLTVKEARWSLLPLVYVPTYPLLLLRTPCTPHTPWHSIYWQLRVRPLSWRPVYLCVINR